MIFALLTNWWIASVSVRVYMPVFYGEGYTSAFYQLQVEIFREPEIILFLPGNSGMRENYYLIKTFKLPIMKTRYDQVHHKFASSNLFALNLESFSFLNRIPPRLFPNYRYSWNRMPKNKSDNFGVSVHASGQRFQLPMSPEYLNIDYDPRSYGDRRSYVY